MQLEASRWPLYRASCPRMKLILWVVRCCSLFNRASTSPLRALPFSHKSLTSPSSSEKGRDKDKKINNLIDRCKRNALNSCLFFTSRLVDMVKFENVLVILLSHWYSITDLFILDCVFFFCFCFCLWAHVCHWYSITDFYV